MISISNFKSILDIEDEIKRFLESFHIKSVFYTIDWLKYLDIINEDKHYFIAKEKNKIIAIICLVKNKKGRFKFNYLTADIRKGGFFILKKYKAEQIEYLFIELEKYVKDINGDYLNIQFYSNEEQLLLGNLLKNDYTLTLNRDMIVPIQYDDTQLSRCSQNRRTEIKKALADESIKIELLENSIEFIDVFYPLYSKTMEKYNVSYVRPYNEILALLSNLNTLKYVAYIEAIAIASVILLISKDEKTVYYFYSAKDIKYSNKNVIEKIFFNVFSWARGNQFNSFNLMQASINFNSGIYNFKKQWGAEQKLNIFMIKSLSLKSKIITLLKKCIL